MIRDALFLVAAVVVLIVVADWYARRAGKDIADALPKLPSGEDIVAAPGTIVRGFWDFIKQTGSGTAPDAGYINQEEARQKAKSELAARRSRFQNLGAGLR